MPQLIAMVIVVVGAMIYMFQTFGGTGDKIEGVAQKTSVMTEINNIRGDLIVALKSHEVTGTNDTLAELANLGYFTNQMNTEIGNNVAVETTEFKTGEVNTYSAISFGGETNSSMNLSLIVGAAGTIPGIRVHLFNTLAGNALFLEGQLARDLASQASIDTLSKEGEHVSLTNGLVPAANRVDADYYPSSAADGTASTNLDDGIFTIYFKDLDTSR